ncbi:MAG: sugar transporter [Bacteroidia bacterium]|nr:MAG: sugar transporter [Bacteroidia bacterium]
MRNFLKTIILIGCILIGANNIVAQNINLNNMASVDVKQLTEKQLNQIVAQIKKNNMSIEQAMTFARTRGASQLQIDQLKQRIKNLRNISKAVSGADVTEETTVALNSFSQKKQFSTTKKAQKTFGFQFFNSKNLTFSPNVNIPVSDDYTLGLGDEIVIAIYGASQKNYQLRVHKTGAINIPDIGPINVYGIPFKQAKRKIKSQLTKIYNGLKGDNPNTFADISLGTLTGIKINIIGDVNVPGTYTLPPTATVFNGLYLAGGPNIKGSYRNIDVIRNGKVIKTIDVYAYLVDGKTANNIQLRNQDVIFVRPYINRINIEGQFKRTGLFETKKDETVADIIRYAGGFTEKAYTYKLDLYRNNTRSTDFITIERKKFDTTKLANGDLLIAGEIVNRLENIVTINGAIYRPGNYELKPNMYLSQLIKEAEGLKEDAFMERGIITRRNPDHTLRTIAFSVTDVLNGKNDIQLKSEDVIKISSLFDMREKRTVSIEGEVQFPGVYQCSDNLTIQDLIFNAGGFKKNASVETIEVSRILSYDEAKDITQKLLHTYQFHINRNLKLNSKDAKFELKPFDKVYVRRAPGYRPQSSVSIAGEVKYAGGYSITQKDEKISDLIKRAGGLTPEAYKKGASLRRKIVLTEAEYQAQLLIAKRDTTSNIREVKRYSYRTIGIDLPQILKNPGGANDLILKDGDQLNIPTLLQTITVSGAVLNPVGHTYTKKNTTKEYIMGSGGFAQNAKRGKVYIIYANGTTATTKRFLFFRSYPKVEPGCKIIVPRKPEIDRSGNTSKWLAFSSALATLLTAIAITLK